MTNAEFREWFDHHVACFTGIPAWLKKATTGQGAPNEKAVLFGWFKVLENIDLTDAKAATDKLHSGEEPEPMGFDRHPATIRGIAIKNRKETSTFKPRQIIDGEIAYACLDCKDTGYLVCWHPEAMRHYRNHGNLDECRVRTCVRACICREGDQYEKSFGRFDTRRWLVHSGVVSENESRLRHFIENSQDSRREKAFDQFR